MTIEYRNTHFKTLGDGATGSQSDPVTIVRGVAVKQPDGTFAEVSDENPVPITLSSIPLGEPINTNLAPGETIELIPAPPVVTQQIHLYGIYLTFAPAYVTGTEFFEALIFAYKTGQPEIEMFPLLGIETFDGFSTPVQIEAGCSLRLRIPDTVELSSVGVCCTLQYRYGYPEEGGSNGGGGGSAVWGSIEGDIANQIDLGTRFALFDGGIETINTTLLAHASQFADLTSQDVIHDDGITDLSDRLGIVEGSISTISTTAVTQASQITANTSAIALKQDQLTGGAATTYNSVSKAIDIRIDSSTLAISSNNLTVVYAPSPRLRGDTFLLSTTANFSSAATAPTSGIIKTTIFTSNYSTSAANSQYSFRTSSGSTISSFFQRSIAINTSQSFVFNFYLRNSEAIGVFANTDLRLSANVQSEIVYEGVCESGWITSTPQVFSSTITTAFRSVSMIFLNNTASALGVTVEVLDASNAVVAVLMNAVSVASRNYYFQVFNLSAGRRLRISAPTATTGTDMFINIYARESAGW